MVSLRTPGRVRPAGSILILTAALLVATAAPAAAEDFTFAAEDLLVLNMIGRVEVVPASGSEFQVSITVGGDDAKDGLLEFHVDEGDEARLVVKFPVDEERNYVYPEMGRHSKTTITYDDDPDHGGSWLKKVFAGMSGKRVTVRGKGKGLEVWADLKIAVPAGASLRMENRVGAIDAEGVAGDLYLDTGTGRVTARDIEGDLTADTGSGSVEFRGVRGGKIVADTGSGSVEIHDARGSEVTADTGSGSVELGQIDAREVTADTGSGGVRADQVSCRKLVVDTGSGSVKARNVAAEAALIDTGSGSVLLHLTRMGTGRFEIDTGSGSIEIALPDDASARISADTSSGGVHNELASATVRSMTRDEMELVVGEGEARVILDAGSGSITVSSR